MPVTALSPQDYIDALPQDRQPAMEALRQTLLQNLPAGFQEEMSYGMIGYVVPHTLYPAGYHCDPKLPLPFLSIASQKNFIAVYHMGLYADPELLAWFTHEYPKHSKTKLDMGKSCIRFKKPDQIPLELLGELASKMPPQDWITLYKSAFNK
ncbi:DUF1801 domain-containing protein [Rufibacter roseolus]|uniref:DUF1801 domain-containing protein n=1 Tax=Rufibacter roseolus TaxID=2817375 RepID=UPI001B3140B8|nr:DUF1801 domain-containing protein [Rufibacter roseolus]